MRYAAWRISITALGWATTWPAPPANPDQVRSRGLVSGCLDNPEYAPQPPKSPPIPLPTSRMPSFLRYVSAGPKRKFIFVTVSRF